MGIEKFTGGIVFGVSMNTGPLSKNVKHARTLMGGFVGGTSRMLGGLQAQLAGVVGVGGMTMLVKSSFQAIDALHDTAKNLGVTTEALSSLGHAAVQSGSSQENLARGMFRMTRTTRDAALGVDTAARAYAKLGLDAKALNDLSPDKQFKAIAEAVSKLTNKQDQLTVAQDIFGKGAKDLVETLRLGEGGLNTMADEAERLGAAIKTVDAKRVAEAADAFNKIKKAIQGIGNSAAIALAPAAEFAEMFINAGKTTNPITKIGLERREREARHLQLLAAARFRHKFGTPVAGQTPLSNLAKTPGQIWEGLSGSKASMQRSMMGAELSRAASGGAIGSSGGMAAVVGAAAKGFASALSTNASQIFGGMRDSPIAQLQRTLAGASLKQGMRGGMRTTSPIGEFAGHVSGSTAANQQRVRGQQQFEKVEAKQLVALEQIVKNTAKEGVSLSNMGRG